MDATLPGTYEADGSPVDVDLLVKADWPVATENDPSEYHDKYAYIQLTYDQEGLVDGAVGWGGYQETEEYSSSMIDAAVRFAPEPGGDDPTER